MKKNTEFRKPLMYCDHVMMFWKFLIGLQMYEETH
jgi:hypothetical protein